MGGAGTLPRFRLPGPYDHLQRLGVRRLSAGAGVAREALNRAREYAAAFLAGAAAPPTPALSGAQLNALLART